MATRWLNPIDIYSDSESFLRPVAGCAPYGNNSYTRVIEKQEPCGFSIAVCDHHLTKPIFFHVDSSKESVNKLVQKLRTLVMDIYKREGAFLFFRGNCSQYPKLKICWVLYTRVYMPEAEAVQHYFRQWVFTFNDSEKTNTVPTNLVWLSWVDSFSLALINQKISVKEITRATQNLFRQADYNNTLLTCSTLRAEKQGFFRKSMFYKRFQKIKYVSQLLIINATIWMRELKHYHSATTKLITAESKTFLGIAM